MTNLTDKFQQIDQNVTTRLDTIIEKMDDGAEGDNEDMLAILTQIGNSLRTVAVEYEYDEDGNDIEGSETYPEEDENLGLAIIRIANISDLSNNYLQQIRDLNQQLLFPHAAPSNAAIHMILAELASLRSKLDEIENANQANTNQIVGVLSLMATAINTMTTTMRGIDKLVVQQQGAQTLFKKIERNTARMVDCCKTAGKEGAEEIIDDPDMPVIDEDSNQWARITQFVIGEQFSTNGILYNRFYPICPGHPMVAWSTVRGIPNVPPYNAPKTVQNPNMVMKWDFSSSTTKPSGFSGQNYVGTPPTSPLPVYGGMPTVYNPIKGSCGVDFTTNPPGANQYWVFEFYVPASAGTALPLNVWVHYAFTSPTPAVPGIKSTGITSASITGYIMLVNLATWPATTGDPALTTSSNLSGNRTRIHCAIWENYRIYVESSASVFSVSTLSQQRFKTGEWITLAGDHTFEFAVSEDTDISVIIQPR